MQSNISPETRRRRAKLGGLKRVDPELYEAERREFLAHRFVEKIEALVDKAPPLSDEQRRHLRRLLAPAKGGA